MIFKIDTCLLHRLNERRKAMVRQLSTRSKECEKRISCPNLSRIVLLTEECIPDMMAGRRRLGFRTYVHSGQGADANAHMG